MINIWVSFDVYCKLESFYDNKFTPLLFKVTCVHNALMSQNIPVN